MIITSVGIVASFLSVLCAHFFTVTVNSVGNVLKYQLAISTIYMTLLLIPAMFILPSSFSFIQYDDSEPLEVGRWYAFGCILFGLWSGMLIGFITEYFTSNNYGPTLKLVKACDNGPAPNII